MSKKKKKKSNNKQIFKILKIIAIMCVIVLFLELSFMIYKMFHVEDDNVYFDSVNSFVAVDNGYVAVGGNNDNENYYEKAKITKYNAKREKTFEKLYNKGYLSSFSGVVVDKDGYVAVGGYEKDEDAYKKKDWSALIVKYDVNGEILWEKDFQMADNSYFNNIQVVSDGYIVVGESNFKKENNSKDGGAYLVKYSKEGKLVWKKNLGENTAAKFNDLLISDNFIYTVGSSNSIGLVDKFDMEGNLVKEATYETVDTTGFTGITRLNDNIYVVGADDKEKALIVQYDLDCNFRKWYKNDELRNARFNQIMVDKDNLVVIGIKYDNNEYDGIIGKYKTDLEKVDVVSYGEDRDDYFTNVILKDGNYLVVGYSSYENGDYLSKFINYSDALKVLEVG